MNNFGKKDMPIPITIKRVEKETPAVKTFYFDHALNSLPGQFVMLWIPGIDQKPFSVALDDGKQFALTVSAVGNLSTALCTLKAGDRVWITGPFGTSFSVLPDRHYVMVAGGYGAAPLGFLSEAVSGLNNVKIDFLAGARTCNDILFEKRLAKLKNTTVHCATNDGSQGYQGYVTDMLSDVVGKGDKQVLICSCGPELMQKKVLEFALENEVECEVSIERYMKCGFGVCGQCCVDDSGYPMCQKGPVVNKAFAKKVLEFGRYHRDKTGAKHNF